MTRLLAEIGFTAIGCIFVGLIIYQTTRSP